ncbi:hypothetical protein QVD17_11748 [Tagetes erecta]|uniref:F-box domain-containing protein n=1 Tax=Tagetes erecta TaxID=13708 RepID=A0AAD8L068_TARER|nr:hypothetical protein QVD17_11748 [Tagetes erecta]
MDMRFKSEVDIISTLPQSLLETILCLLPTKEAARTSILSSQWRFSLAIGPAHLAGKDCSVVELFECLPVIEHLTIFGYYFKWLVVDSVPQELPTLLFHLKYFFFEELWFPGGHGLAFLFALIKCSPNLEKLKIQVDRHPKRYDEKCPFVWQRYSNVRLEHLNELEVIGFGNLEHEMEFLKFILAS